MGDSMEFASREAFRSWLSEHGQSSAGVWLLFGKAGGPKTLKAGEALEEALCFGWIDGQMQRIDEKSYRKYFSQRRERSKWSEKNKALVQVLEERGLINMNRRVDRIQITLCQVEHKVDLEASEIIKRLRRVLEEL